MASCEKCWDDSYSYGEGDGRVDRYIKLLAERRNRPCSPEEQAGPHATECRTCKRRTYHQHAKLCMNPNCFTSEAAKPGHMQWPPDRVKR